MNNDYHAILRLMNEYCYRVDQGDLDGFADLFSHAKFAIMGDPDGAMNGRDEVRAYLNRVILYDGKPLTKHVSTNVQIDIADNQQQASAQSYTTVLQAVPPDFPMQPIFAGHYHDQFEKVDNEWRFKERQISADLIGDLSVHLSEALN
ncbi:MAG: nuclear transport factor 2 family protein [Gammaproteobacteria bacterium]|nr:nuclear transport factor 2 family protein [Gammaproteobacteria bacterium]